MKFQRDAYSCGVFAILNGAEALGVHLTERAVRQHTGTTKDGTTQHGVMNALERLGFVGTAFTETNKDAAYDRVLTAVREGKTVILNVEEEQHWVVAIGACGRRVVTFDSYNSKVCKAAGGTEAWDTRSLRKWWTKQVDGKYYGIVMERT